MTARGLLSFVTNDTPFNPSAAAVWQDVTNTAVTVSIPSGSLRRIESTFNAESQCRSASWCSVRVVVVAGAITTELLPASGTDFAFDSPSAANHWEAHSVDRNSPFRGAGTYTVKVQAMIIGPVSGATFRLDDYSHRVKLIAP